MKFALPFVAVFAFAAVACGDTSSTSEHPTGDAAAGETLYTANCETCHGADAVSGSANENLPNVANNEIDEFFTVVQEGKGNGEMPSFPELSDQDIADIAAYCASL